MDNQEEHKMKKSTQSDLAYEEIFATFSWKFAKMVALIQRLGRLTSSEKRFIAKLVAALRTFEALRDKGVPTISIEELEKHDDRADRTHALSGTEILALQLGIHQFGMKVPEDVKGQLIGHTVEDILDRMIDLGEIKFLPVDIGEEGWREEFDLAEVHTHIVTREDVDSDGFWITLIPANCVKGLL